MNLKTFIMIKKWKRLGTGLAGALALVVAACVYFLNYPKLGDTPAVNKWYRVHAPQMKSSDGGNYRAFFKKGRENKVMVYFAGGGVSVNEQSARDETYIGKFIPTDRLANWIMNMGGLASPSDVNPFSDWTVIAFPYATGDFHAGTGEFPYIDKNGKPRILHHQGYINFQAAMDKVMRQAGIAHAEAVLVTGYSAGGAGASLLADDIFTRYFPRASQKVLLVDGVLLLKDDWRDIARNVWKSPAHISDRIQTQDLIMDQLRQLREKWKDEVLLLFSSTTRDGELVKFQNYFKTGEMKLDEQTGDEFQSLLKSTLPTFQDLNVHLFVFDDKKYDKSKNLTSHTIIATPYVFETLPSVGQSVAQWMLDAMNGKPRNHGLELLNKEYPRTE